MAGPLRVLCLNTGSSSLKFALYELGEAEARLATGAVEHVAMEAGRLWVVGSRGETLRDAVGCFPDARAAVRAAFDALAELGLALPTAVGHRVVHGGPDHATPERVDAALLAALRRIVPLAPLHLPAAIEGIEAVGAHYEGLPQVACFDTAFHRRMPQIAQRFPLPRALWDQGVRRYGFHGLSYEYLVRAVGAETLGRAVLAHLGNGASLAAVDHGRPLDTTMGLTPTGGFLMGTRSGDLDPGVLLHLARRGYTTDAIERLVNLEAGLLGVSGETSDMKCLLDRREREPHAAEAVAMFCYQLRKHIGAMAAVLGGLDTLVFTGGIGERAAPVRWEACAGLAHLGIRLDARRNAAHEPVISTPGSGCTVRVVPTDEDLMVARHTREALEEVRA